MFAAIRRQDVLCQGRGPMIAGTGRVGEFGAIPHERRHGWLKNGNPSGDFSTNKSIPTPYRR